jgi:Lon protease-like protein
LNAGIERGTPTKSEKQDVDNAPELGVFSHPNTVLFPGALLPLHFDQPRSMALLADAVATHRHLVVAVPKLGMEAGCCQDVYPIGCAEKSFVTSRFPTADPISW